MKNIFPCIYIFLFSALPVMNLWSKEMTVNYSSIDELRSQALQEMKDETQREQMKDDTPFINRGLSLQDLNPELSITGDFLMGFSDEPTLNGGKSDFIFRGLGLHFESYIDPYTRLKAAVPINSEGAELGEAYITNFSFAKSINLTVGKFRQNFGTINRWHKHALDQTDFPLALRKIYGDGGLNQTGLSLEYSLPAKGKAVERLSLQITDGDNALAYGENESNKPSILARYSNYRDLTSDKYFEFGITATTGWNNQWEVNSVLTEKKLSTRTYAVDMVINNEPSEKMRYRNSEWRLEAYYLDKDILATDNSGKDSIQCWGFFSSFQKKVSRITELGIRYDYFKPDSKNYDVSPFGSHVTNVEDNAQSMISPYVTWYKTPFIHYRMEFNHMNNSDIGEDENRLMFQVIFAAGPHKHERY